jgi:2'-5' RNA ligase
VSLVALCYPTVTDEQQRFMDDLRSQYDLAFKDVVRPHFTLVFPVRDLPTPTFQNHVQRIARTHVPFRFVCRYAMVHDDRTNDNWYVFLVPDEGFSEIARLHDDLYTGLLASHLRLDLPYVPHIAVATLKDRVTCKEVADRLNRNGIEIAGTIDALSISEYDGTKVRDVQLIALGNATG